MEEEGYVPLKYKRIADLQWAQRILGMAQDELFKIARGIIEGRYKEFKRIQKCGSIFLTVGFGGMIRNELFKGYGTGKGFKITLTDCGMELRPTNPDVYAPMTNQELKKEKNIIKFHPSNTIYLGSYMKSMEWEIGDVMEVSIQGTMLVIDKAKKEEAVKEAVKEAEPAEEITEETLELGIEESELKAEEEKKPEEPTIEPVEDEVKWE